MASGTADPPISVRLSELGRFWWSSRYLSSVSQTVGTPKLIVDRLHAELKSIEAIPEFKEQVAKLGTVPVDTPSVAELQAYVKSEIVRWGKIVDKSGAAMD